MDLIKTILAVGAGSFLGDSLEQSQSEQKNISIHLQYNTIIV